MSDYSNRLIFGKNSIERITSCEIEDDGTHLFIENEDGTVTEIIKPTVYWMLAGRKLDQDFSLLDGRLFFNHVKTYDTHEALMADKKLYYGKETYMIHDRKEASMVLNGYTYFKGMKVQDVSVLAFDIESQGLERDNDSRVYIISNTFRKQGKIVRKMFSIDEYESEKNMIDSWCSWVREMNPSVLLGHNIFSYDLPYLDHCATLNGTSLKLGRNGSSIRFNNYTSQFRKDGSQSYEYTRSYVYGREIVDTMFLAYKYDFSRKYITYGLKQIIKQEGLEIPGRQFYDAGKIAQNWHNLEERKKIKAYAEQDGDDALALYDLMIPSFFYWNQAIPKSCQSVNYSATGSQINAFLVRSYLQNFHSIPRASDSEKYDGAVSFGIPGIYKNVFKVDVASLYPSIMLQYEVYDRYKDPQGNFFQMVKYFTEERLKNKKLGKQTGDRYYKDLEQSQKIGINSAYGMLGANGLHFNSPKNAAFVTTKGREILGQAIQWASGKTTEDWMSKGEPDGEEESLED